MEREPLPPHRFLARTALGCVVLNWLLQNPALVGHWWAALGRLTAPFAVGAALAFVGSVPLGCIERRLNSVTPRLRRPMALAFLALGLVILLSAVVGIIAPQLRSTLLALQQQLPAVWERFWTWAEGVRQRWPVVGEAFSLREDQALWEGVQRSLAPRGRLLDSTVDAAAEALSALTNLGVGLVLAVYILARKETLCRQLRLVLLAWLPRWLARGVWDTLCLSARTFSAFLTGQCLEACLLGSLFAVTLRLCHMPYALFISVLIGFGALVPIVGSVFGCLAGAVLIACRDPVQALWFVGIFLALQQLEGSFIYPRVVGSKLGLPGLWVLAAVTLGGRLFGVVGMMVMIPLCSVLYTLLAAATQKRLRRRFSAEKRGEQADSAGEM